MVERDGGAGQRLFELLGSVLHEVERACSTQQKEATVHTVHCTLYNTEHRTHATVLHIHSHTHNDTTHTRVQLTYEGGVADAEVVVE